MFLGSKWGGGRQHTSPLKMKLCVVLLAASSKDLLGKTTGAASEQHEKEKQTIWQLLSERDW